MKKNGRSRIEIELELKQNKEKFREAAKKKNFVLISFYLDKVKKLEEELDATKAEANFFQQQKDSNSALVVWSGKVLNLCLNTADLSLYYLDLYEAYFKERGFVPTEEWKEKRKSLERALKTFSGYVRGFFSGKSSDDNNENMVNLMELIEQGYFTEEELKYHKEYEDKV